MKKKQILCSFLVLAVTAFAVEKKAIDFVVGVDGDFREAMAAASGASTSESDHFVIFFPEGEYDIGSLTGDENQMTTFTKSHVSLVGQGADNTVLFNKSINEGISISATLKISADDIYVQDLSILNRAIYGSEWACGSVCRHDALMTVGDRLVYKDVKLLAAQDTYYTKVNSKKKGRSYWEGGQIEGTVDYICGDGDVFFEGTKLVVRRNGGIITASQNNTEWGYVFHNAVIEVSDGGFNGSFYLGRSWGHAKTVFLNTTMSAQPTAEGWYEQSINEAPVVFGEYNSKDGNGNSIYMGTRRTTFLNKDKSAGTPLKTVWDANDAAPYTLANVLGGTDNWEPGKLTEQVPAPVIKQSANAIVWDDYEDARAWVVFVDGKYQTNVVTPSFSLEGVAVGSKVTVRAANFMGGLGGYSNEVTTVEKNSDDDDSGSPAKIPGTAEQALNYPKKNISRLFSITGKLLREATGNRVSTENLNRGTYILLVHEGSATYRKIIRVE